jgi:hypothetical protein
MDITLHLHVVKDSWNFETYLEFFELKFVITFKLWVFFECGYRLLSFYFLTINIVLLILVLCKINYFRHNYCSSSILIIITKNQN